MGHYYECLDCGEERCRCGPPSRHHDPSYKQIVSRHRLDEEWFILKTAHTHYSDAYQAKLSINGEHCPVEVVVSILDKLTSNSFTAGMATVSGPMYRQILRPDAASSVVIQVCERLGLSLGEYRRARGLSLELGSFTFIGHRHGPWRDKAIALAALLREARELVERSEGHAPG